jgi:hypothetical protein
MIRLRWLLLAWFAPLVLGTPTFAQLRAFWLLQETTGTTAVDTSSLSNNGTYTNTPALASSTAVPSTGAVAAGFDGVNDYVAIPNESNYDLTGPMTVCCWIKVDVFDTAYQAIVTKGDTAWRIQRYANTNNIEFSCTGLSTNTMVVSSAGVNDGQWHHIAGVYTGSQLRIYIDGVLSSSVGATGSIATNANPVEIGRNNGASGREFDGSICNVVIYNGALDATSIAAIYNWDAMVSQWKLRETSGTTASDSMILLNHGTYKNNFTLGSAGPYPGGGDKGVTFDGNGSYVETLNEYYYDLSGPMTVAAWVRVTGFTLANQTIIAKGDTAWRVQRDGTSNQIAFQCNGLTDTKVVAATRIDDGYWHHVAGVYDGTKLSIYIDGKLSAADNSTGAIARNNYNVFIGENADQSSRSWFGGLSDVRVYSVALSAAKVAKLYGLVGHWKLNQTSGTTATDTSVIASNGTVNGTANWSSDCGNNGAFDFNGSTNYITIPDSSYLRPTSALTIAGWVKGNSWGAGSDADTVLRKGEASPTNYSLGISDGRVELTLDGTDGAGIRGNTVLATGQWYHVAAVWDGATVRLFVNGVLDNTPPVRTGTINTDTRTLYIGGRSGSDLFNGMLRDVRFYNRAVYDSEIKKMAGMVGHWTFAEGAGTTAADSSGQGNTANLSGGATWTSDCAGNNNALLTNGTGGIAQTASMVTPPDAGTVAFWMRSTGTPTGTARIMGLGGDWEIRQINDGRVISDLCGDGATTVGTVTPLTEVGRWYHFAATFDSDNDTYAIYVDGKLELSGTNSVAMSTQAANYLSFGTRTGTTEYWSGALRDVRIYNRRLCPTEIAELYGLVGHWKLDETSGPLAADSSGLGRNLTVVGTANWVGGAVDNALQLNGSTRAEVVSLMGNPKNITLAGWANLTGVDSNGAELVSIGDHFAIRLNEGSITRAFFYNGTSWVSCSVSQTYLNTGWHHFAAVYNDDQNTCKLYVDGVERASVSATTTIPFGTLGTKTVIGAHGNGGTTWDFTGRIDDVRIYNRALCPNEISSLHSGGDTLEGVKIIKWVEVQ